MSAPTIIDRSERTSPVQQPSNAPGATNTSSKIGVSATNSTLTSANAPKTESKGFIKSAFDCVTKFFTNIWTWLTGCFKSDAKPATDDFKPATDVKENGSLGANSTGSTDSESESD